MTAHRSELLAFAKPTKTRSMKADSTVHRASKESPEPSKQPFFWHESFGWSLLSLGLFWLSFPPVNWWLLAWVAPIGWIYVIRQDCLTGRRPILCLYFIGWLHWLSMTYWVTLPHPSAAIGWLFLAAYLALFVVGFILLARWLVHRSRVPPVFAVPIAWVTMEVSRTYLFTGFGLVPLSHSQVDFLSLIQIASITGAYGVSFIVAMCATTIATAMEPWLVKRPSPHRWWPTFLSLAALGLCVAFGFSRLRDDPAASSTARVAIVQGALDTVFGDNMEQRNRAFADYSRMTSDVTLNGNLDLVIWPESMFWRYYGITKYDPELATRNVGPDGMTMEMFSNVCEVSTKQHIKLFGVNCLMGSSTTHYHGDSVENYNTAAFYNADGDLSGVYHKMHPVMFGEYIPFGDVLPWLYNFAPIPGALTPGRGPRSFVAGELSVSPCICFENTVPHLIRRNLVKLEQAGETPQALATLTNDGWFWGSSLLDLHLACGIYRAVENRRPMLIAANTGISAHIDDCGRVLQASPKRVSRVIVADVEGRDIVSPYTQFGDWFGFGCVLISIVGIAAGKFFANGPVHR